MSNTNAVPQGVFGPGLLFVKRTDIANQGAYNIGKVQEFSWDLTGSTKSLYGQNQLPLLAARGEVKASGKMKAAVISGLALNAVLMGESSFSAGQLDFAQSPATAIPTTPFHITPTVPDSGTFDLDLGVTNASGGAPLLRVFTTPTAGQYEVDETTGVYTFSSADNVSSISVKINFAYRHTAAGGQGLIYTNKLIGTTPTFQIDYRSVLYGASFYIRIFSAISSKLAMAHKLTDFALPEIDFEMFANSSDNLLEMSFANVA